MNNIFKKLFTQKRNDDSDILLKEKPDRRLLSKLPDKQKARTTLDRRRVESALAAQNEIAAAMDSESLGKRYLVDYEVLITLERKSEYYGDDISNIKREERKKTGKKVKYYGRAIDISGTGVLLEVTPEVAEEMSKALSIKLKFEIEPGTMPEGYEMKVNIDAKYIRTSQGAEDGKVLCGMLFSKTLAQYATRNKNWYMLSIASFLLFVVTVCVMLMRVESVIYFRFNKILYLYSILAATFLLTRYLFGSFYRPVPIDPDYTPGVTVIIPCFNEEEWIERTILSCINQDYPPDKLEVIVVDDCSTDNSFEVIKNFVDNLKAREKQYHDIENMISYVRQDPNAGKRDAMARGALLAKYNLLVFVDSDSFLDPFAVRNIVQPFKDSEMGGVTGRTDVANTYTNALTKMQSVRYYIAFRVMKAAESLFDTVTCLSGPLSCYRKDLVLKYLDPWLNQKFLGQKATFGDDRAMTNFILRENRTCYQDTAVCSTIVPKTHKVFLKQQMRWKRSWLRESMLASRFMWKKEPFASLTFYMGVLVPVLAPIIVIYNAIYVPIVYEIFPFTFIAGLLLMSLLMAMSQLLLRKSSTWLYGLMFCVYYVGVLLWQMPYAWVTFWKSTWGTRPTPADILEEERSKNRKFKIAGIKLWK